MKFLGFFIALLATANVANAQSISDEELQARFNKAFSVFNQKSNATTLSNMTEEKKVEHKKNEQQAISLQEESDKNIVKKSNNVDIVSQELPQKPNKLTLPAIPKDRMQNAANFILLEERDVLIDMENVTLKEIVQESLNQVAHGEKWTIRWRLKDENKYLLKERINLTAEVNFDKFIGSMIETIANMTGIRLTTKVFNKNRIIIITDSF